MTSAAAQPADPRLVPPYSIKGGLRIVFQNLRKRKPNDPKAVDDAETEAFAMAEPFDKVMNAKTGLLEEARAHFAAARARLAKGEGYEVVIDELEAAIMPILEHYETRIASVEAELGEHKNLIGAQQNTIGTQQEEIGTLKSTVGNTEALLDLRQCSMFLQPEFATEFLKETKKFRALRKEQRNRLAELQPDLYRIINTFGRGGNDFVHHRRTIIAAKLKEYILNEYKDVFVERDVDQFLAYFNTVLRRTRKDSTIDVYKQAVELGTKDMSEDE